MEHEQRQSAVERGALEGQGAGIRLPDFYSRVGVAPDRFLDKDWRIVDRGNLVEIGGPGEREVRLPVPQPTSRIFSPSATLAKSMNRGASFWLQRPMSCS